MKRLHIHMAVEDLAASVRFYTALFASEPTIQRSDYAKWQLDDPRVNFALSARGGRPGLDHLGIQVDSDAELASLNERLASAALPVTEERGTACCYAESDKYWTVDPQGTPWEAFHTLGSIPVFGESAEEKKKPSASSCCSPVSQGCGS